MPLAQPLVMNKAKRNWKLIYENKKLHERFRDFLPFQKLKSTKRDFNGRKNKHRINKLFLVEGNIELTVIIASYYNRL